MQVKRLLVLIATLFSALEARAQPPKNATIEEIVVRWKQRQEATKTFRITWTQTVLYPKSGYSTAYPSVTGAGATFPPNDLTLAQSGLVVMDDTKARYEYQGHAYSTISKSFTESSIASRYDGKTGASLREAQEGDYTLVTRRTATAPPRLSSTITEPFLRAFRPANSQLSGLDLDYFQVTGRRSAVNSRDCIELTLRSAQPGVKTTLWLDPEREYHVVRYHQTLERGVFSLIQDDVRYEKDSSGRWLPNSWIHTQKNRTGGVLLTVNAKVTECEVCGPVDSDLFDTKPPNNSRVTEFRPDGKTEQYVIRPDGNRRDVLAGEETLSHSHLVSSEPGEGLGATRQSWLSRNWISLVGGVLFLCGLTGAILVRRSGRKGVA